MHNFKGRCVHDMYMYNVYVYIGTCVFGRNWCTYICVYLVFYTRRKGVQEGLCPIPREIIVIRFEKRGNFAQNTNFCHFSTSKPVRALALPLGL